MRGLQKVEAGCLCAAFEGQVRAWIAVFVKRGNACAYEIEY